MCLKILENNFHKDIIIKQGEFFLLPARIPHSPQRTANSCGLVIERRREPTEIDCVRWFVPHESRVLYEKWFHCKDLGIELIPLIKNYFESNEYRTKLPEKDLCSDESENVFKLNKELICIEKHGFYNLIEKINGKKVKQSGDVVRMELVDFSGIQFRVSVV